MTSTAVHTQGPGGELADPVSAPHRRSALDGRPSDPHPATAGVLRCRPRLWLNSSVVGPARVARRPICTWPIPSVCRIPFSLKRTARLTKFRALSTMLSLVLLLAPAPPALAQEDKFLLLATNRTGTMQDELNEAGARGYRFRRYPGRRNGVRRPARPSSS